MKFEGAMLRGPKIKFYGPKIKGPRLIGNGMVIHLGQPIK